MKPFPEELQKAITDLGYHTLTPIQLAAMPLLREGRDVIGQSKTGSGKTAAFGLPLLEKVDTAKRTVQALILCPTRELCEQVAREMRKLGKYKKDLRVLPIFGGTPGYLQRKALEQGVQVVVATPGRLLDHVQRKAIDLSTVHWVVLDEADRMLDMGFRDKIELILNQAPHRKQTALFSATFPETIGNLSKRYQKNPQKIEIETLASEAVAIEEVFCRTSQDRKPDALLAFLRTRQLESVLVFCNLKITVDNLTEHLRRAGFGAERLHGDLEQHVRERVMAKFRNQSIRVLVATDVAARGIDVAGLDAVVNFDLPNDPAQYVHRIGRTGRAGQTGLSLALVTPTEGPKLERLEAFTGKSTVFRTPSELVQTHSKIPVLRTLETLSISGGRKDKLRAGDILGALTGDAGLPGTEIGKIEILDRVSFVAIDRKSSRLALARLREGKIKGRRFLVDLVS